MNELGKQYCDDSCYLSGSTCSKCIGISGCIWLEDIQYTNEGTKPSLNQFCTQGGSRGPKNSIIQYETTMTMPYTFTVTSYNYMTCAMSATALNTMIIAIICSLIAAIIIVYVSILIYKKVRYNKLLKEAAKREVTEEDKKLLQ